MSTALETARDVKMARRTHAPLSQRVVEGITGAMDAAAAVLTGIVLHAILSKGPLFPQPQEFAAIGLYTLLLVLGLHVTGAYNFRAIVRPLHQLPTIAAVAVAVMFVLVTLAFALKISTSFSRLWTFSWLLSSIAAVLLVRVAMATMLRQLAAAGRIGRKIVIFGAGPQAERLIERIERLDEPWNRIVGVFDDRLSRTGTMVGRYPMLGNLNDLVTWGRRDRPDEVIVALPWGAEERLVTILKVLSVLPSNVRLCSEFQRMDLIHGRANSQFGVPMLSAFEKPLEGWSRIWKRLFDLFLSAIAMAICLPVLAIIALAIRIESPGPVLFRQKRFGFNNALIGVYKFRTMHAVASDALGERLTERNDPRVTKVGAFLRRFSLDELPQLLNVVHGQMSVVGPRPHAIRTTAGGRQCEEVLDQYAIRHKVKPGITGWAQVNGWRGTMEDEEHLIQRVAHDLYYINNWSPWLDLKILLRTIGVVIAGRNSY
jgi:Undecaprenyl-phosphate glucose phosphotransferase